MTDIKDAIVKVEGFFDKIRKWSGWTVYVNFITAHPKTTAVFLAVVAVAHLFH